MDTFICDVLRVKLKSVLAFIDIVCQSHKVHLDIGAIFSLK